MADPLTYNELLRLMHLVDKENVKARQMADFFVAHYPDKLVYWQAEIATNYILYKHLVMLADEQLRALRK